MNELHYYDDIIDRPYHRSENRRHMPIEDRAAQFSPFAALTGHEAVLNEAGRLTDYRHELGEDKLDGMDILLADIEKRLDSHPLVEITYYIPDTIKQGGAYAEYRGHICNIDRERKIISTEDGHEIKIFDVTELKEL